MTTVEELEKVVSEKDDLINELQKTIAEYEQTVSTPTSTSIIIDLNKLSDEELQKLTLKVRTTEEGIKAYQMFNYGIGASTSSGNTEPGSQQKTA